MNEEHYVYNSKQEILCGHSLVDMTARPKNVNFAQDYIYTQMYNKARVSVWEAEEKWTCCHNYSELECAYVHLHVHA